MRKNPLMCCDIILIIIVGNFIKELVVLKPSMLQKNAQ